VVTNTPTAAPTDTPTPEATDTPTSPPIPEVVINEIRIDQDGADDDEYFELSAEPGTSLDNLTYLVIGDGTGGSGVIENVTDLSGHVVDIPGYFIVAESTFTLGVPDMEASLNFENSDNVTHLLVYGFTGSNGDDLDTDDDGVLDVTPWSEVLDAVGLVETVGSGDQYYGEALGFTAYTLLSLPTNTAPIFSPAN
jgi:hypothetical protein